MMKRNIATMMGWTLFLFIVSFVFLHPVIVSNGIAAESSAFRTATIKIEGMDCSACAKDIRSALLKTPGVKAAEVKVKKKWFFFNDFSDARAAVEYEEGQTTVDDLIKAVEGASNSMFTYHARLLN